MKLINESEKSSRANLLANLFLMAYGKKMTIKDFQKENKGLVVDGNFGLKSFAVLYQKLLKIVEIQNFGGYYFQQSFEKKQIVWHHSAGWDNARGMFDWWRNDGVVHVATSVGIVDDGTVFRGYDESYWAHHIGMRHLNNVARNQQSVAVEICNWGNLTEKNGKLYSWANIEIPKNKAIELNFKGSKYYEVYTDQEIESLKKWTLLMALRFDIPLVYKEKNMWDTSEDAINGVPGLYTHNSFPVGKNDVSPQPKLIEMAKSLESYFK